MENKDYTVECIKGKGVEDYGGQCGCDECINEEVSEDGK